MRASSLPSRNHCDSLFVFLLCFCSLTVCDRIFLFRLFVANNIIRAWLCVAYSLVFCLLAATIIHTYSHCVAKRRTIIFSELIYLWTNIKMFTWHATVVACKCRSRSTANSNFIRLHHMHGCRWAIGYIAVQNFQNVRHVHQSSAGRAWDIKHERWAKNDKLL